MNAELLAILDYWEKEKGISRTVLLSAVEEALLSAAKKAVGPARELRVQIDPKSGDIKAFAKLIATDKVISKHDQISIFDARRIKADVQIGEEIDVEVTPTDFGRIASQNAKQAPEPQFNPNQPAEPPTSQILPQPQAPAPQVRAEDKEQQTRQKK